MDKLIRDLCAIHAPSGDEGNMTAFLLDYFKKEKKNWKVVPKILTGYEFGESILLVFGKPTTAIFAHIDNIGFTVRYGTELIPIGSPHPKTNDTLHGEDSQGKVECKIQIRKDDKLVYKSKRQIETGTSLSYKVDFHEDDEYIQSCYLDNRLGVWNALKVAETLENGIIAFSCREEHGGGNVSFLGKYIYEKFEVRRALICDITWVTEGVHHGQGVVISLRDSGLPTRSLIKRIIETAKKNKIPYQLEVERYGGSDGIELQKSSYPFEWCFVGAPEKNAHTTHETVHKADIKAMTDLYVELMKEL